MGGGIEMLDEEQDGFYLVGDDPGVDEYDPFTEDDRESLVSTSLDESRFQRDTPHWVYDSQHQDWVRWQGGNLLLYREYQKAPGDREPTEKQESRVSETAESSAAAGSHHHSRTTASSSRGQSSPSRPVHRPPGGGSSPTTSDRDLSAQLRHPPRSAHRRSPIEHDEYEEEHTRSPRPFPRQVPRKKYLGALDPRFNVVDKPKRFFSVGRIFKTVWFEPGGQDSTSQLSLEYTKDCPPFYGEQPFAKFRWFVVVRKRLHHSLCFSITTFGRRGATKGSRGRSKDFVVLYSAAIEPPEPFPEENIERDPVAVIIEDGEQCIAPVARLDCGRIYTVEDNLKVMKLGRVHPDYLERLEEYYKESVR